MGGYGPCVPNDGSELYGVSDVGLQANLGEVIYLRGEACFMVFLETLDPDFKL